MPFAPRWLDRKLSLMEGVMAWLLIAIAIGMFSRYMFIVFGKTEKSMIERTVLNINTALNYNMSIARLNNDIDAINNLLTINPLYLMTQKPSIADYAISNDSKTNQFIQIHSKPTNYLGEVIDDSELLLESGNWYFDIDDHVLFYRLRNAEFFKTEIDGPPRIRYKIKMKYIDLNSNDQFDLYDDDFVSIKLQSIDKFEWLFN